MFLAVVLSNPSITSFNSPFYPLLHRFPFNAPETVRPTPWNIQFCFFVFIVGICEGGSFVHLRQSHSVTGPFRCGHYIYHFAYKNTKFHPKRVSPQLKVRKLIFILYCCNITRLAFSFRLCCLPACFPASYGCDCLLGTLCANRLFWMAGCTPFVCGTHRRETIYVIGEMIFAHRRGSV